MTGTLEPLSELEIRSLNSTILTLNIDDTGEIWSHTTNLRTKSRK